jgi:hypothetical protein
MKRCILSTLLLLLLVFSSGCYTTFKHSKKVTPRKWQKKHSHEIQHAPNCKECYEWDYYYRYPAWMQIGESKSTGYKRFWQYGDKALDAMIFVGDITFDILLWCFDHDDDDDHGNSHRLPEDRNKENNDKEED